MEFKDKVLHVRAVLKLSQTQLSQELGVGIATINRWETGKTKPNKRDQYAFNLYCEKKKIVFNDEVTVYEKI